MTEGRGANCARCGAAPSAAALRAIPPKSAFQVWHIALMSAAICVVVAMSAGAYGVLAPSYRRLFADLGRTLPALTKLVMRGDIIYALYACIAATSVYVFLLARQRIRRGQGVGTWTGRVLFCELLLALLLNAVVAEGLYRPLVELVESLR